MKRTPLLVLTVALGCGAPAAQSMVEAPRPAEESDVDGDGIVDASDACPCLAEDVDGVDDEDGCPDVDNDGDNIPDICDACPNDPEPYNGTCDEDGCPDRGHICVEMRDAVILDRVPFELRSARIQSRVVPILEAVAQTLIANPGMESTRVHGHALASEPRAARLAEARARAVLEALVALGVDASRLSMIGEVSEAREVTFDLLRMDGRDVDPRAVSEPGGCGRPMRCEPVVCAPAAVPVPNCQE